MDINETYFSAEGQVQLKKDLIQCYKKPDPLITYACLSTLANAARNACQEVSTDALNYALDPKHDCQPLAGEGKHFVHLGLTFGIQFVNEYNYNQGDELGKDWAESIKLRKKKQDETKALTEYIAGLQKRILAVHDRLVPTKTKVSLSYYA